MIKLHLPLAFILVFFNLVACQSSSLNTTDIEEEEEQNIPFYYGADLSYLNEMIDCGAIYKNENGIAKNPYQIFAEAGTNLVRVRLWHTPNWTTYSNLDDVKKTITKAKAHNMKVLLDFHYSDTWADPSKQQIPLAWSSNIDNTPILGNLLYQYTFNTLTNLSRSNLLPDMVQVGNEINIMILQDEASVTAMNWTRNAFLINQGIRAVRDFSNDIEIMLHIAQPENALWWFKEAVNNGITDFDWIGLSYYPIWSEYKLNTVLEPLRTLKNTYNKKLMAVETAYPYTLDNADSANNILNSNALIEGYPATQQGQLSYLNSLCNIIKQAGGEGLIYWEPAWVSTPCYTLWGQGSHWDNATLFDHNNQATLGMSFYNKAKK
ncbi:MAG: arabinogalactan endo-beta-1,4-galactanase [Flavobacteriaceae bacterium]